MSARARHERIEREWSAPVIALYLDRGVITEWPFELVRPGYYATQKAIEQADETGASRRS